MESIFFKKNINIFSLNDKIFTSQKYFLSKNTIIYNFLDKKIMKMYFCNISATIAPLDFLYFILFLPIFSELNFIWIFKL